jgi:hypothetical protein
MVTKADLHRLIDALPERALPVAERLITELTELTELEADEAAPHVPPYEAPFGEPEEDELQAIAEGRAAITRGDVVRDEDLARELGL